jgi:hypothetical protein
MSSFGLSLITLYVVISSMFVSERISYLDVSAGRIRYAPVQGPKRVSNPCTRNVRWRLTFLVFVMVWWFAAKSQNETDGRTDGETETISIITIWENYYG